MAWVRKRHYPARWGVGVENVKNKMTRWISVACYVFEMNKPSSKTFAQDFQLKMNQQSDWCKAYVGALWIYNIILLNHIQI